MADGAPFFAHAAVHYGQADWAPLVLGSDPADPARTILESADKAGILRPYVDDGAEILPGIRAVRTPGHTPGSYVVELRSHDERLYFTGDVLVHPGQLGDPGIGFMMDLDRSAAQDARARLFATVRRENAVVAAAHVRNPRFRRIAADGTWTAA